MHYHVRNVGIILSISLRQTPFRGFYKVESVLKIGLGGTKNGPVLLNNIKKSEHLAGLIVFALANFSSGVRRETRT
jgi:hypothetical protein